jgi:hypothetical protein
MSKPTQNSHAQMILYLIKRIDFFRQLNGLVFIFFNSLSGTSVRRPNGINDPSTLFHYALITIYLTFSPLASFSDGE